MGERNQTGQLKQEERVWSLRREWTRAFAMMLVLLLIAGIGTIGGLRQLIGQFSGTASQRDRETAVVSALRNSLVDHEQTGHKLLTGDPVDSSAFLRQQDDISEHFAAAIRVFPSGNGTRAILERADKAWQDGLTKAGLWGEPARTVKVNLEENPIFGAASDDSRGILDELEAPSLQAVHAGLATGARLERLLILALAALFGLALAVTWHFRRKMTKDLLRPVASMHLGVLKLRGGELNHRIQVARNDELGELAEAFNAMADALHETHRALTQRATHDSLTGLANRASLAERLETSFGPASNRRSRHDNVLFIDIDDFKIVNDSLGHDAGDDLLLQLAARLGHCVRSEDLVARLGGDEFAIVVSEAEGGSATIDVAERVLAVFLDPFTVDGVNLNVGASIGVAQRRPDTVDAAELLRQADFAMYMAKGGGKGRYEIFDAQMHGNMLGRTALKSELSQAVAGDQLRLEYQPVVDLNSGRVLGVEALVRWEHPTLGRLAPNEFIPLSEETGDIDAIGAWVLSAALDQLTEWREKFASCADLWVAVNLSAVQLRSPQSLTTIGDILSDPKVDARKVVFEVTETSLAIDVDGGIAALNTLKVSGARIAIDDFGTGYSSLSTLASLPVDILKIDRSFISGCDSTPEAMTMLDAILGLARKLSLSVVAEGIEQLDQMELLRDLGCPMGQGFLLARPASAQALEPLLCTRVLEVAAASAA